MQIPKKIYGFCVVVLLLVTACGGGGGDGKPPAGGGSGLPPDPRQIAPPLNKTVATDFASATQFLYTGNNPIQTGVSSGTIDPERVAVLRGRVKDRNGDALDGVVITVSRHPECGQTLSRTDGRFDIAVNGGGLVTINYAKAGYLKAQRQIFAPKQDYAWLPEVRLVMADTRVTPVNLGANTSQVARGNTVSDNDGTRTATVLIPLGTNAQFVLADGTTQPATTLNIRATEYTVGDRGPESMPAELPATSGYTYALELSADEADSAGAKDIQFSQPLYNYVEDFIGFPVGSPVPAGYYDRSQGRWIPAENGVVIKILSATGGLADIDADGDGSADNASQLDALNITAAERVQLAQLYQAGQQLWRVPITHFTPWDYNWPYGPPEDAEPPNQPEPDSEKTEEDPCEHTGSSILEIHNQVLGERIAVVGTPFSLNYRSSRMLGNKTVYSSRIHLSGASVPSSLKGINLEVQVAGQQHRQNFPPDANLSLDFTWDGKDGYGRDVMGRQPLTARVGYVYDAVYYEPAEFEQSFGAIGSAPIEGVQARDEVIFWQTMVDKVGPLDARAAGLGGWTLDVHHIYDPIAKMMYRGDGQQRRAQSLQGLGYSFEYYFGFCIPDPQVPDIPFTICPTIPTTTNIVPMIGVAASADGGFYVFGPSVMGSFTGVVHKITPDGRINLVAGGGGPTHGLGDGGPANEAVLGLGVLGDIAIGPDGSLYITHQEVDEQGLVVFPLSGRVRRVAPNGIITTVAGGGEPADGIGDGGPATLAKLSLPAKLAAGLDGSLYISDSEQNRVRRVGIDGVITTFAGGGSPAEGNGDGGPAIEAEFDDEPGALAIAPDGSLAIVDGDLIRRVGSDGIITTIAGGGMPGTGLGDGGYATQAGLDAPDDIAYGPDGSLFIADTGNDLVRMVSPLRVIATIAGSGDCVPYAQDCADATAKRVAIRPNALSVAPDSSVLVVSDLLALYRLSPEPSGTFFAVASEDGDEVYRFDAGGRHLETLTSLTGIPKYLFRYDGNGFLTEVEDGDGNITVIERDGDGSPMSIVSAFGQRTAVSVNSDGYLGEVLNPAGHSCQLSYTGNGLLTELRDPRGHTYQYTYDDMGRLIRAEDPARGFSTLARTSIPNGYRVTRTTAEGLITTYQVERHPSGARRFLNSFPGGVETETRENPDGSRTLKFADGTLITLVESPDPRFGALSPLVTSATIETPAGLKTEYTFNRSLELVDANDPLSLKSLTDTTTVNGKTYSSAFEAATKQITEISPTGRQITTTIDTQTRPLEFLFDPALAPIQLQRNEQGLLINASWADVSWLMAYDMVGRRITETNAAMKATYYDYDGANRIYRLTLPSGRVYEFDYDGVGNLTRVTTPKGDIHQFTYTPTHREENYIAPGGVTYASAYDKDGRLTSYTLPSGRAINLSYDNSGRLQQIAYPEAIISYGYDGSGEYPQTITRTPTGGPTQTLSVKRDGSLVTEKAWRGVANGTYRFRYGNDFLLEGLTLDNEPGITLSRDDDGLVEQYGPFTVSRSGPEGAPDQISDANLSISYVYDTLGRLKQRTHSVAGQIVCDVSLNYDNQGLVRQKTETVNGSSDTYNYDYDNDGQLIKVEKNTAVVEEYEYNFDGSRIRRKLSGGIDEGQSYDAQTGLLTARGNVSYESNADRFIIRRGSDSFVYSAIGELLNVRLNNGTEEISYSYDHLGRQVARTDANGTEQYLYGELGHAWLVTASRASNGVLSIYFYDQALNLFAIQQGNDRFYVATDSVGSPVLVADGNGQIIKSIEYDTFGNVLFDSNPGFGLPIGFAGGLQDAATGLVRFGVRNYEPATGRWTAPDPLNFKANALNPFAYADNDPVNVRDPSGFQGQGPTLRNLEVGPKGVPEYGKTLEISKKGAEGVDPFGKAVRQDTWRNAGNALCGEESGEPEDDQKPRPKSRELQDFKQNTGDGGNCFIATAGDFSWKELF